MVKFERNCGARILQTTMHDLEEMFSLRLLLEVPATHRTAQQAGPADLKEMRIWAWMPGRARDDGPDRGSPSPRGVGGHGSSSDAAARR
jgi:hypothetical protein